MIRLTCGMDGGDCENQKDMGMRLYRLEESSGIWFKLDQTESLLVLRIGFLPGRVTSSWASSEYGTSICLRNTVFLSSDLRTLQ